MFRAEAKGRALHFDTDGVVGGNEVFKDRETGSHWQQTLAKASSGPFKGADLKLYPFLRTTWGEWKKQHPNSLVLKPLPGYAELMPTMNKIIHQGASGLGAAPKDAFGHDDRLRPRETIVGLEVGPDLKAYPFPALRKVRVVNDKVGGTPVLIVHQPSSDTTTAFDTRVKDGVLTFAAANQEADKLTDLETHSSWNAYGLCISGQLKGTQLKSLILVPEFWYAWSEFHPKTDVYNPDNAR